MPCKNIRENIPISNKHSLEKAMEVLWLQYNIIIVVT